MTDVTFVQKTEQEKAMEAAKPASISPFERIAQIKKEEDHIKEARHAMSMNSRPGMPSALHQGLVEFHDIWCELHSLEGDKRSAEYKKKAQHIAERLVAKHHEIVGLPH